MRELLRCAPREGRVTWRNGRWRSTASNAGVSNADLRYQDARHERRRRLSAAQRIDPLCRIMITAFAAADTASRLRLGAHDISKRRVDALKIKFACARTAAARQENVLTQARAGRAIRSPHIGRSERVAFSRIRTIERDRQHGTRHRQSGTQGRVARDINFTHWAREGVRRAQHPPTPARVPSAARIESRTHEGYFHGCEREKKAHRGAEKARFLTRNRRDEPVDAVKLLRVLKGGSSPRAASRAGSRHPISSRRETGVYEGRCRRQVPRGPFYRTSDPHSLPRLRGAVKTHPLLAE